MDTVETRLFLLRIAHSVQDVAHALDLDAGKFFYVVQNTDDGRYYKTFRIPKKREGFREISQPVRGLALAQDRLAPVLHHVYSPKEYVKGFVSKQSFLSNARYHQGQRWVLNIDLKDFFGTISFPRVFGLFRSNLFGFNYRVSTILARICTFQGVLPQGASTSPVLANIIANSLDRKLVEIARSERVKYTRYSDDITFSSSRKLRPKALVKSVAETMDDWQVELGDQLRDAVSRSGFSINEEKTRLMLPNNRQEVTGLVVNQHANVRRKDISRLRMKLFSVKKVGGFEQAASAWGCSSGEQLRAHLLGWLAFVRQVRGASDPVLAKLCLQAYEIGMSDVTWIEELADMTKEFDVFLSHASEDKDRVRKLKDSLEAKGVKVFFDETTITWGDSIVEKVNHGLLKSTFFMPFLTKTFSEKGWTNKELNSAISTNISRKSKILPIKDHDFDLDTKYALLNDILYQVWPKDEAGLPEFLDKVTDAVVGLIEAEKQPT